MTPARNPDLVHIRKYPNRRLYDTSQSRHLTHDGVIEIINSGRSVVVTDSRSGDDITTIVLLQILIERDPAKLRAVPADLIHRAMRTESNALREIASRAVAAWRGPATPDRVDASVAARPATASSDRLSASRPLTASSGTSSGLTNGLNHGDAAVNANSRPKAKAKRID